MKPLAGHQPAAMVATPGASEAPAGVPDVDVVVVNWNTRELLRECLLSLRRQVTGCRVDISVIDNASRDGSPDMVRRDFPGARLVANQRNVGFAAACNQGLAAARGRYVLLLNADTRLEEDVVSALARLLDARPDAALAGCLHVGSDGAPQPSCARQPSIGGAVIGALGLRRLTRRARERRHFDPPFLTLEEHGRGREVDIIVGACMLARRAAVHQVGGLDETIFLFAEEWEWCLRLRRAGWKVLFTPTTRIVHHGAASWTLPAVARARAILASQDHVYRKAYGPGRARALLAAHALGAALRSVAWAAIWLLAPARRARSRERLSVHRATLACILRPGARRMLRAEDVEAPDRRPLLVLDPIGHVLGSHDRALSAALAARGHRVTLLTNGELPARFRPAADTFTTELAFRGVVGDGPRLIKGLAYARMLLAAGRRARALGADTVLLYYALFPPLERLFLAWLRWRGVFTVLCAHDVLPLVERERAGSWYRALYLTADRVLAFSDSARRELVAGLGVPASRLGLATLGCDHVFGAAGDRPGAPGPAGPDAPACGGARGGARGRLGIPLDEPCVLCFGQIKPTKGLDVLLPAFVRVRQQHPRARLWIVGRPWRVDLAPVRALVERIGLGEAVVFRPWLVPEGEVPDWFLAADLVVLPYTRLYQSAVLPQAAAFGTPIVATRAGNVPDLLTDGETAWLVEPRDPEGLGRAIAVALSEPAEARRRAEAARRELTARCTWAEVAATVERLLPDRGGAPRDSRPFVVR